MSGRRKPGPLYIPDPDTGCWVWQRSCDTHGYGHLGVDGRTRLAHRWMWEQHVGPLEPGRPLDHICRNRRCVNPEHLRLATKVLNGQNQVGIPTATSRHRGVHWHKATGKWAAQASIDRKQIYLGLFEDEEEAARVVSEFRAKHMPFSPDARAA